MLLKILIPAAIVGAMGLIFGIVLAVTSKLFAVKTDPVKEAIRELLPGANCGGCGFAGCDNYAQTVADGKAEPNCCPVAGEKAAAEIGRIVGRDVEIPEKSVALVCCQGDTNTCNLRFDYDGPPSCRAASLAAMGDKGCQHSCLGFGDCAAVCAFGAIVVENNRIARIDQEKCTGCGVCVKNCPRSVIKLVAHKRPVVCVCSAVEKAQAVHDNCTSGCIACGKCAKVCHFGAITMKNNLPEINYSRCMSCMQCADSCPTGALKANEQLRRHAMIHYPECNGCDICMDVCHFGAIRGESGESHSVIDWNCVGCGWCSEVCPHGCIEMLPGGAYKKK